MVVQTHNTVEDRRQRPTTDSGGGVYTYEAIAPMNQGRAVRLRSELRLHKSLAEQLKQRHDDQVEALAGPIVAGPVEEGRLRRSLH